jgi:mannose-6-phosphate isomerase-like protein (cupin superfamily)
MANASQSAIPHDDPTRKLSATDADRPGGTHIAVVGDTYTIVLGGKDTNGRYCLIDMLVPPGGGPPPHRHDFEEMFSILEGEIEITFRGDKLVAKAGTTVNVPANAPHSFKNVATKPARLLCLCSPAGQEEFFMAVGKLVASRTSPAPRLSKDEQDAFIKKAASLAAKYRTELLGP